MACALSALALAHSAEDASKAISWSLLLLAAGVFPTLLFLSAPYGRYTRPGWGPGIPAKWAWLTQEAPAFCIPVAMLVLSCEERPRPSLYPTLALSMFLLHYGWRAFCYPFFMASSRGTPFSVWALAFLFCCANGFQQGASCILTDWSPEKRPWLFGLGASLWAVGWGINFHSDWILRRLHRKKQGSSKGYAIPGGGMFEFVSAGNYFGEILEWAGWALACRNLSALSFAVFTFSNLGPRGLSHHRFYQSQFPNYPRHRRAVIPFVW